MGAERMMTGGDSGNAMTEIALALAMAFFAIMILTMVSMGAGGPATTALAAPDITRLVPSTQPASTEKTSAPARKIEPRQIVVFALGRFFDAALKPLDPAAVADMDQPVLAVPPDLTFAQVMAAKRRLPVPDITVTGLDPRWLQSLKEIRK
jgi:hypothetical protein